MAPRHPAQELSLLSARSLVRELKMSHLPHQTLLVGRVVAVVVVSELVLVYPVVLLAIW